LQYIDNVNKSYQIKSVCAFRVTISINKLTVIAHGFEWLSEKGTYF
jgi:hypothetical protein